MVLIKKKKKKTRRWFIVIRFLVGFCIVLVWFDLIWLVGWLVCSALMIKKMLKQFYINVTLIWQAPSENFTLGQFRDVASNFCQEGKVKEPSRFLSFLPNFSLFPWFFLSFPWFFPSFPQIFPSFWQIFHCQGGTLPPAPPCLCYWDSQKPKWFKPSYLMRMFQQNSVKMEKVYFRSQPEILERPGIGEYWNISSVPVLPKNVMLTFFRTCWWDPEASNTGTQGLN